MVLSSEYPVKLCVYSLVSPTTNQLLDLSTMETLLVETGDTLPSVTIECLNEQHERSTNESGRIITMNLLFVSKTPLKASIVNKSKQRPTLSGGNSSLSINIPTTVLSKKEVKSYPNVNSNSNSNFNSNTSISPANVRQDSISKILNTTKSTENATGGLEQSTTTPLNFGYFKGDEMVIIDSLSKTTEEGMCVFDNISILENSNFESAEYQIIFSDQTVTNLLPTSTTLKDIEIPIWLEPSLQPVAIPLAIRIKRTIK